MKIQLTILVSGATGNQGGAVARALIANGHKVRALCRNPKSSAARQLAAIGADVIEGDLNDIANIAKVLQGADTFFLMGSPFEAGIEGETNQGMELADAAKSAGIGHLVYSSVANADRQTGIPHFDSKYKVEQHIQSLDIPYTISAPVYFMDNAIAPWAIDALKAGKITQAMPGNRKLQQVSVQNIGEFVASLITRRTTVFGKRFDIAGDELTGEEMAQVLARAIHRQVQFESLPVSVLREQSHDMAMMYEWFDNVGYSADIASLRLAFSDVDWQSYDQWATAQDWRFLDTV